MEVFLLVLEQGLRRLRDEDLSAVPGGADPGCAVNGESGVAPVVGDRLTGVQTHSHLDLDALRPGVREERELALDGREHSLARARERNEERVALRIHLVAVVSVERISQQLPVVRQNCGIPLAQLLDEPRRPLDVGEEEGDCAARHVRHAESLTLRPRTGKTRGR